jgi:protein phosphatase
MGTTMVACVFDKDNDEYYAVNVGDSRLYIIDEKKHELRQITKDHSLVQDLVDIGALTKEQAEKSPKKNIITRVLGMDYEVDVDFYSDKYESGVFLLCSDGLNDYVSEDDIVKLVSQWVQSIQTMQNGDNDGSGGIGGNGNGNESGNAENIEGCLASLISKANENGGGDNITAVIITP